MSDTETGMTFQQKVNDLLCFYRSKCHITEKLSKEELNRNYTKLLQKLEDLAFGHHVVAPEHKRKNSIKVQKNKPIPDIDGIPS